jgi:hypothetical protein
MSGQRIERIDQVGAARDEAELRAAVDGAADGDQVARALIELADRLEDAAAPTSMGLALATAALVADAVGASEEHAVASARREALATCTRTSTTRPSPRWIARLRRSRFTATWPGPPASGSPWREGCWLVARTPMPCVKLERRWMFWTHMPRHST